MPKAVKRRSTFGVKNTSDMDLENFVPNYEEKLKKGDSQDSLSIEDGLNSDEKKSNGDIFSEFLSDLKKKRAKPNMVAREVLTQIPNQVRGVMEEQAELRRKGNDQMVKSLNGLSRQLEADQESILAKEQMIQQFTVSLNKVVQQDKVKHNQRLQSLIELKNAFERQCESLESAQKQQVEHLCQSVMDNLTSLQKKLVAERRRSDFEAMKKSMMLAFQAEF